MKYILGIDFGDGETVACYAPVSQNTGLQYAKIKNSTDIDGRKIISLVMRSPDGKYGISLSGGELFLSFKKYFYDSNGLTKDQRNEQLLAFKFFIRDVFSLIRKNHNGDIFQPENEVEVCIAAPTNWPPEVKSEYRRFVADAIGQDVKWVINESDAAYFSKKSDYSDDVVLVIDYGSSTIDFTLMENGKKLNVDILSTNFGASQIEESILLDCQTGKESAAQFSQMMGLAKSSLEKWGNQRIDIIGNLKLSIRKAKESAYTDISTNLDDYPDMYICGSLVMRHLTGIDEDRKIKFEYDYKESKLQNYKDKVKECFQKVKEKAEELLSGKKIDRIILSGGGSIMPWVEMKAKEVWDDSVEIVSDTEPSYVVAKGIVNYALELYKCPDDVVAEFDKWLKSPDKMLDGISNGGWLKETLNREINLQAQNLMGENLYPILDSYLQDKTNPPYRILLNNIETFLKKECNEKPFLSKIISTAFQNMKGNIEKSLCEIVEQHYCINVKNFEIDLSNIDQVEINIDNSSLNRHIHDKFAYCKGLDKTRKLEERREVVDHLKTYILARKVPIHAELKGDAFESVLALLRESLRQWAIEEKPFFVVE